ncbi:MAG: alpha-L-rhamnosidase N-terminal domain-containing protein [Actinomycetota bacterium]
MTATWPRRTPARRWTASWIWSERSGLIPPSESNPVGAHNPAQFDQRVLFRREFDLDEQPATALLAATADSRYIAHLNGQRVGSGPGRHDADTLTYDEWDVAGHLRPGRNIIAVMGRFYGAAVPWWAPSRPSHTMGGGALAVELEIDGEIVVATDETWMVQDCEAWIPARPQGVLASQPAELHDARLFDPGWTGAKVDPAEWRTAHVIPEQAAVGPRGRTAPGGEPYGALLRSGRPLLVGKHRELPVEALLESLAPSPAESTAELVAMLSADIIAGHVTIIDAGLVTSGRLRLTFAGESGDIVRGGLLEAVGPAAFESGAPVQVVLDDGETVFEPFDTVGGRYLVFSAHSDSGRLPRLVRAEVTEVHRPRHGAHFACSDPELTRIVEVSLRTVDLSAVDAYLDCPTREQRAWTGDSVIHQSVDLVMNADWSLAVWNPVLLARPRADGILPMAAAGDFAALPIPTIPDWSLHWITSVHNLMRYTADREVIAPLLPVVESALRWFLPYVRDGRLVDVPGWVLIDWSPVQVEGSSAALTALWARGLRQFAEIALWMGDRGRADWADETWSDVVRGFGGFWDAARGAYRDNILATGVLGTGVSEHVAAAAVLAELVPAHRIDEVRALLRTRDAIFTRSPLADHGADALGPSEGTPVWRRDAPDWDTETQVVGAQPFFRAIVHDAVRQLGGDLLPLYQDWHRLLEQEATALRECWEGGSYCHGWSATVARDVVVHTLGVSPAQPGYDVVRVAPHLEDLEWAEARIPTPHGDIEVRVDRDILTLRSPVPSIVEWGGEHVALPSGVHTRQRTT